MKQEGRPEQRTPGRPQNPNTGSLTKETEVRNKSFAKAPLVSRFHLPGLSNLQEGLRRKTQKTNGPGKDAQRAIDTQRH